MRRLSEFEQQMVAAYAEGRLAEMRGLRAGDCPHGGGEIREQWIDGWLDARRYAEARLRPGTVIGFLAGLTLLGAALAWRI